MEKKITKKNIKNEKYNCIIKINEKIQKIMRNGEKIKKVTKNLLIIEHKKMLYFPIMRLYSKSCK